MYRENKNMNHDAHQTILRGDLYYADLSPVVGSEQGGVRPVLVIQNDVGNKYSPTVIVAAITSRSTKAAIPTHVCIRRMRSGLKQDSTVKGIHRTSGFRTDGGNRTGHGYQPGTGASDG